MNLFGICMGPFFVMENVDFRRLKLVPQAQRLVVVEAYMGKIWRNPVLCWAGCDGIPGEPGQPFVADTNCFQVSTWFDQKIDGWWLNPHEIDG